MVWVGVVWWVVTSALWPCTVRTYSTYIVCIQYIGMYVCMFICCSVTCAVMGPFAFPLSRKWQGSSSWLPSATQSWPMWMRVSAAALATTRHTLLPHSGSPNLSCLPLASSISAFILPCVFFHLYTPSSPSTAPLCLPSTSSAPHPTALFSHLSGQQKIAFSTTPSPLTRLPLLVLLRTLGTYSL